MEKNIYEISNSVKNLAISIMNESEASTDVLLEYHAKLNFLLVDALDGLLAKKGEDLEEKYVQLYRGYITYVKAYDLILNLSDLKECLPEDKKKAFLKLLDNVSEDRIYELNEQLRESRKEELKLRTENEHFKSELEKIKRTRKGINRRDDITEEAIRELYEKGYTTAYKIAQELDCSEPTIRRKLKAMELK